MENNQSNDYKQDGKLYIKQVDRCYVLEKKDDEYHLQCKIKQHGETEYHYCMDDDYLSRNGKNLWLSEDAKNRVQEGMDVFNGIIDRIEDHTDGFKIVEIDSDFRVFYRRTALRTYEVIKEIFENGICKYYYEPAVSENYFFFNRKEKPQDNALYNRAVKYNDLYLKYLIEYLCGVITKEGRLWLQNEDGIIRLPKVNEKLNKYYYVKSDEIPFLVLRESGYVLFHTPYFGMYGSTHKIYELNPYHKQGNDSAPKDAKAMSWKEFYDMCEENAIE